MSRSTELSIVNRRRDAKTRAKNRGLSRLISKSAEKTNAKLSRPPPPRRQRSRAGRRRRRRG